MTNKIKLTYGIALLCFVLQFVLLAIGTFNRDDIAVDSASMLLTGVGIVLFKSIPWLVLLPGLLMKSEKIMAWMSYVCLVYFIIWTLGAFGVKGAGIAGIGVFVTIIQFTSATLNTRWSKQLIA